MLTRARDDGIVVVRGVQPDVIFISKRRQRIIRNQVWGAPDLVVEILSAGTAAYDRTAKRDLYREYGVKECWLVDPAARVIDVIALRGGRDLIRRAEHEAPVRSRVLRGLRLTVNEIFD